MFLTPNLAMLRDKFLYFVALLALLPLLSSSAHAQCSKPAQEIPSGLSAYYVLHASGTFDSAASPAPSYFHNTIMGRSAAEIAAIETEAKNFFNTEFGVVIDGNNIAYDTENKPIGVLGENMLDPAAGLKVVTASGTYVPAAGWTAYVRRHFINISSPHGARLGGNYNGSQSNFVPQGTVLAYGEIHIVEANDCGATGVTKTFITKSLQPFIVDFKGRAPFLYGIEGISGASTATLHGRSEFEVVSGTNVAATVRWVIKAYP